MQHLHPEFPHGIEFLSLVSMENGVVSFGGLLYCGGLALTNLFAKFLPFLKLRYGLGTCFLSELSGLRIFLIASVFRSGV